MSYDISLRDRVTGKTLMAETEHMMRGGTYAMNGTREMWLNITWNYASYYYDATEGDERFANDGGNGEIRYGIRGIYGKSGAESIPMLKDMIARIEAKYKANGEWITTTKEKQRWFDENGTEIDHAKALSTMLHGGNVQSESYEIEVNEGPTEDYWKPTAGNAIKPLYSLMAMAQMFPDGEWEGD